MLVPHCSFKEVIYRQTHTHTHTMVPNFAWAIIKCSLNLIKWVVFLKPAMPHSWRRLSWQTGAHFQFIWFISRYDNFQRQVCVLTHLISRRRRFAPLPNVTPKSYSSPLEDPVCLCLKRSPLTRSAFAWQVGASVSTSPTLWWMFTAGG